MKKVIEKLKVYLLKFYWSLKKDTNEYGEYDPFKIVKVRAYGKDWVEVKKGTQKGGNWLPGVLDEVCYIKQLPNGNIQIDYSKEIMYQKSFKYIWDNQTPNTRLILYPNAIEYVEYEKTRED